MAYLDALYLSVVTLATLGYGDIAPTDSLLRLLAPHRAMNPRRLARGAAEGSALQQNIPPVRGRRNAPHGGRLALLTQRLGG
jgi:hypothetical protein